MQVGSTCGEWQTSPTGASQRRRLRVACRADLECAGWVDTFPEGQIGNHFGRCVPAGSRVCKAGRCTEPLSCVVADVAPAPGECFFHCADHADCPGPFQICALGGCLFQACSSSDGPDGGCRSGTRCENAVCVSVEPS